MNRRPEGDLDAQREAGGATSGAGDRPSRCRQRRARLVETRTIAIAALTALVAFVRILAHGAPLPADRATSPATEPISPPAADPLALRIVVDADGPVVVTGAQLAEAGWALDEVDPAELVLSEGGLPVAFRLRPAADSTDPRARRSRRSESGPAAPRRRLSPGDRIEFIGAAHHDDFTDAAVYWLQPNGPPSHRLRFANRSAAPLGGDTTRAFTETIRLEADTVYVNAYRPEGGRRWMWDGPLSSGETRALEAIVEAVGRPDRAPPLAGTATIRVFVQGHTDDPALAPDHHMRLEHGDSVIADIRFDGRTPAILEGALPSSALGSGAAPPVLRSVETGAVVNAVFLDRIELERPAALEAPAGRIEFELAAAASERPVPDIRIGGIPSNDITIVDATNPRQPIELLDAVVEADGAGGFAVRFTRGLGAADDVHGAGRLSAIGGLRAAVDAGTRRYSAWSPDGARPPARIERGRHRPIAVDGPPAAEHLIITHRELAAAAGALAAHRTAGGLASAVVTTDDVYDTYAHGRYDPEAIGRFLATARPRYALLIGEANLDHRGGYAAARNDPNPPRNLVPSLQVEAADGSVATSDLPYADHDGDGVPEVFLGRLPGSTPREVEAVVAKIIAFEEARPSPPPGPIDWRRRSLFVTDEAAAAVESVADGLAEALLPLTPDAQRLYAAHVDTESDLRGTIRESIDDGRLVVAYVGHGNVDTWAPWRGGGRLLRTADVRALSNSDRAALLVTATCMNGWFDHPLKAESIAEAWLANPEGGGIAAWSPTGLARLPGQAVLLHALLSAVAAHPTEPLGDLVAHAMRTAIAADPAAADTARAYAFIGDPATALFAGAVPTVGATPPRDRKVVGGAWRVWVPNAHR